MKLTKHKLPARLASAVLIILLITALYIPASASEAGLEMSTTYPGMSAKAGDNLSYTIDLRNSTANGLTAELSVLSLPEGWNGWFEGNNVEISHVYVKPESSITTAAFQLEIPIDTPDGMRELMALIRQLSETDGRTILISSHQLYQVQQICDRVGIFVKGRLVACGDIEELGRQLEREGLYDPDKNRNGSELDEIYRRYFEKAGEEHDYPSDKADAGTIQRLFRRTKQEDQ